MKNLIILATILVLVFSNCTLSESMKNLQSGLIQIKILRQDAQQYGSQQYNYTLKNTFDKTPNVAFAIRSVDIQYNKSDDFYVKTVRSSQTSIGVSFFYKKNVWNIVKLNFLASSRTEFLVGSVLQSFQKLNNKAQQIAINFQSIIKNYALMKTVLFLNGFKGNIINYIDIQLTAKKCQEKRQLVQVKIGKQFILNQVWFSYIVYNPQQIVVNQGYLVRDNFQGVENMDIFKNIGYAQYPIYGISSLINPQNQFNYELTIDEDFVLSHSITSKVQLISISYVIFATKSLNQCSKCNMIAYKNQCISQCPYETYLNRNQFGSACRKCSIKMNEKMNIDKNKCACTNGYKYNSYNKCQFDPFYGICLNPYQYWNGYACSCKPGFYEQNGYCLNFKDKTNIYDQYWVYRVPLLISKYKALIEYRQTQINKNDFKGVRVCGINEYQYKGTCLCNDGLFRVNQMCVPKVQIPVDEHKIPNSNQNKIPIKCNKNQQYNQQGYCTCKNGYQKDTLNQCKIISPCKITEYFINGRCISCGLNEHYDPKFQLCVCNYMFIKASNGICMKLKQNMTKLIMCKKNEIYLNGECYRCKQNYYSYDGVCKQCPLYSKYLDNIEKCVCENGFQFDLEEKNCIKKNSNNVNQDLQNIISCPQNYELINQRCVQCPNNSNFISISKKCQCDNGYFRDYQNNICTLSTVQQGQCLNNQYLRDGRCVKCQQNSFYEASLQICVCKLGYTYNKLGQCVQFNPLNFNNPLKCEFNQILSNGKCVKCITNSIANRISNECLCISGYQKNLNNQCISSNLKLPPINCLSNSYLDPIENKCKCISGYKYNANNQCIIISGCKQNEFLVNGICLQCSQNAYYQSNIQKCICFFGYTRNQLGQCILNININGQNNQIINNGNSVIVKLPFNNNPPSVSTGGSSGGLIQLPSIDFNVQLPNFESGIGAQIGSFTNSIQKQIQSGIDIAFPVDKNNGCPNGFILSKGICFRCQTNAYFDQILEKCLCSFGYTLNQKAVCINNQKKFNILSTQLIDNGNDGLPQTMTIQLANKIKINDHNIYIVLKTNPMFSFSNIQQSSKFIQYTILGVDVFPTNSYCSQNQLSPSQFTCIFYYDNGLPTKQFDVRFFFIKENKKAQKTVKVNPLQKSLFVLKSIGLK